MHSNINIHHKGYIALIPFGIFLSVFILLNIVYNSAECMHDNFPIFAAITAIIGAFFTFNKGETLHEKVEIFMQGSTQSIVIHMCYIFYISTVFTTVLDQMGGIASAVKLCLFCIPSWCIVPGIFIVASLFSFTVGTSMGAIAAFMPIAANIAHHIGFNPSLMAATIVCGAMFGDNLSILSDTTIAAVKITHATMPEKLALNIKIAAPAFITSLIMLTYHNYLLTHTMHTMKYANFDLIDLIKIIPYIVTFYLAIQGIDIIITLIAGIILAMSIGMMCHSLNMLACVNLMFDGFYASKGMVNVFILVLLLAGLSNMITHNGGIAYLIEKMKYKISNFYQAKCAIFLLITLINMTIAINTISILITGPIAKTIGDDYKINSAEIACILDIGSCICQGILPYAPQILLAASIAQVSTISLVPYLYYQYFLAISLVIFMTYKKN